MFDTQRILEAGLEEALRQMPAAVIIVEAPSGKIVFVNRRAREMAERNLACSVPLELGVLRGLGPSSCPMPRNSWKRSTSRKLSPLTTFRAELRVPPWLARTWNGLGDGRTGCEEDSRRPWSTL